MLTDSTTRPKMTGHRPFIPSERRDAMAQSPSLIRLSREFIAWLANYRNYSEHTVRNYDLALEQYRRYLAARDQVKADELVLSRFTDESIQAWAVAMADQGIHVNTIVGKIGALSSFAKYLMQRKDARNKPLLTANPAKMFTWPSVEHPDTPFLHPEELRAFLGVELPLYEAVPRAVIFDTGVRVSEAARADVGDCIEQPDGWVLVVTVKGRGTRRRKVHMPLSAGTAALVRGYLADRGLPSKHPETDAALPLLANRKGERYTRQDLYNLVRKVGEQAGITRLRVGPHTLRHTINVIRDQGGVNDYERSRMLGQADPRSQQRYRHVVTGQLRAAKDKEAAGLASYLGKGGAE